MSSLELFPNDAAAAVLPDEPFPLMPPPVALARELAMTVHALPAAENDDRHTLRRVLQLLCTERPDADAARRTVLTALHRAAANREFPSVRPETWLLLAVLRLLSAPEVYPC